MPAPIAQLDNSASATSVSTSTMTSVSSQINQKPDTIYKPNPTQVFTNSSSSSNSTSDIIFSSSSSTLSQRKCLISVWSTWYSLIVLALHIYILNTNFYAVVNLFRIKSESALSNRQNNDIQQQLTDLNNQIYFELVSRLILLSLSIVFLLIFILASLKPLGNYSNDGIKFGRDFFFEKLMHNHISQISISHTSLDTDRILYKKNCWFKFTSFLELLWRHFLPIGHVSHLISILMLLFSRIVFTNSTTNSFDKIMNCSKLQQDSILTCVNSIYNYSSISIDFLVRSSNPFDNTGFILHQIDQFKFELASLVLALVSIYIRYGSVFWFTNKSLSFFITFIGIISAVVQLSQVYSFIYIFFTLDKHELSPTKIQLHTTAVLIRNKLTLLFLYLILSLLVYLSATPAYVFSFLKYKEEYLAEEVRFVRAFKHLKVINQLSVISDSEKDHQQDITDHNHQKILASTCCFNYCPHLIATIQLVVICVCKLPLCYDYVVYFNQFKDLGIMLVIIVEILHIIILIFIWLLLTLKTNWKMNLQTEFSICHWTYHLKYIKKSYFNDPHSIFKHLKARDKSIPDQAWSDEDSSIEKIKYNPNEARSKPTIQSMDYQQVDPEHRQQPDYETVLANKQANSRGLPSQVPLRRNVVTIKNNTNKSTQFRSNGTGNYQNQSRDWLDSKHKSLYVKGSEYVTECEPIMSPIKTNSDYILNSETIYRNQLRKSCKDLLQPINQPQSMRPQSVVSSNGITLPIFNQAHNNFNPLMEYENPRTLMDPFFYNNIDQKTKLEGQTKSLKSGIHLTTTAPQIFDSTNSVTKILAGKKQQNMPNVTKIVSNSNSGNSNAKPPVDNSRQVNKEMSSTTNLARSMIYLERPSTSNEYESRV